jgi:hypothetical protein
MSNKMSEEERDISFELFKEVIETAIQEKQKIPKYKKKLDKADVRVNFKLLISKDEEVYTNLILNKGEYSVNRDALKDYTLEIIADPTDLVWFVGNETSIMKMFISRKWKIKKMLLHPFKALFVASLLVYK